METIAILQNVLEHIDRHITEKFTLEGLAQYAGFSMWHFSRMFQWGTGCSVMSYVRSRKLAFAASELHSGEKILDIAVKYGFETHSGFSKAFRRYYGCVPETYRCHACCGKPLTPSLPKIKVYLNGGIIMEPKFVTLPEISLVGFVCRTTSANNVNIRAIPEFWNDYMSSGKSEKLHKESFLKKHWEYGVCFPENPETGEFEYVIGVEPKSDAEVPPEYARRTIPAAEYAVFSTPPAKVADFTQTIQGTWNYIYNEWFPKSGYEYAPGCTDFELYDERCMNQDAQICDIYIPVVQRN